MRVLGAIRQGSHGDEGSTGSSSREDAMGDFGERCARRPAERRVDFQNRFFIVIYTVDTYGRGL